jgi:hypothetical protein
MNATTAPRSHSPVTRRSVSRAFTHWAEGLWFLSQGQADQACSRLLTHDGPEGHPIAATLSAADLAEAAARSGRGEEAVTRLAALGTRSQGAGTPIAAALAARAEGAVKDEAQLLEEALTLLEGFSFDQARTHLPLREHMRRDRRHATARRHLPAGVDGFEQLAAEPWARRARDELRATGETIDGEKSAGCSR